MKRTSRSEFSSRTKTIIAGRAGYRCSFPGCGRATAGPGAKSDQVESTGVAAHIFPASPIGPRGSVGLTERERKSPENGIWLCSEHARLVDANDGAKFPAVLLQNYKALHEANIAREKAGIYSGIGWFQECIIHESPIFKQETTLRFGKVTFVVGDNFTGKTAIAEWIASVSDASVRSFWMRPKSEIQLDVELVYFHPDRQSARLRIGPQVSVKHFLGGKELPFQPAPLRFVFVREPGRLLRDKTEADLDDLQLICLELNLDSQTVRNLLPHVDTLGSGSVRNLRLVEEDDRLTLRADLHGTKPNLPYRVLSHSEQTRVLVDLAITMARFSAEYSPTMLIIEGLWRFDASWFQRYCDYLSEANRLFQTTIVLPEGRHDLSKLHWSGWVLAHLKNGMVEQNPF